MFTALKPWLTPSQENLQAALGLALAALLAALSGVVIARSVEAWRSQTPAPVSRAAATPAPGTASAAAIVAANLFGEANHTGLASALPSTTLSLTLRGVFTGREPGTGQAIIESADGRSSMFSVNSEVANGVMLDAVYADRVVLSRSGQLETLQFPRPDTTPSSQDLAKAGVGNEIASAYAGAAGAGASSEERKAMIRQRLEELRNRQQANPQ